MNSANQQSKVLTVARMSVFLRLKFTADFHSEIVSQRLRRDLKRTFKPAKLCCIFTSQPILSWGNKERLACFASVMCIYQFHCRANLVTLGVRSGKFIVELLNTLHLGSANLRISRYAAQYWSVLSTMNIKSTVSKLKLLKLFIVFHTTDRMVYAYGFCIQQRQLQCIWITQICVCERDFYSPFHCHDQLHGVYWLPKAFDFISPSLPLSHSLHSVNWLC